MNSMHITIKLFATLQDGRFREEVRELPDGTTVSDIRRLLAIPDDLPTLNFVHGRHVTNDAKLQEGDVLALFPPIGGG